MEHAETLEGNLGFLSPGTYDLRLSPKTMYYLSHRMRRGRKSS